MLPEPSGCSSARSRSGASSTPATPPLPRPPPGSSVHGALVSAAHLRQRAQAPAGLGTGVRIFPIPNVTREHRADHATDVLLLAREEDDLLQTAVVPAGHEGAEGLDAVVERLGELTL